MRARHLRPLSRFLGVIDGVVARRMHSRYGLNCAPVFVVGPERSGTTLVYSLLANHPDFYWFSRLDNVFPHVGVGVTLSRRVLEPILRDRYLAIPGTIARSEGLLPPSEGVEYWRKVLGWGEEGDYRLDDDRMTEDDVAAVDTEHLVADLSLRAALLGRSRILVKQTGHALRTRFLHAVFPGVMFVQVVRDPLLNWASLVRAKQMSGERYWGTKPPGWRDHLDSDVELQAATQLETVANILEDDLNLIRDLGCPVIRVSYEQLIEDSSEVLSRFESFFGWARGALESIDVSGGEGRPRPVPEMTEVTEKLNRLCDRFDYPRVAR